jgi:hypothetical protein
MLQYTSSWVTLCNQALARLSAAEIRTLDDGTKNALFCARLLPDAVEEVLAQYDFSCVRRRMTLSPLEERPAYGWELRYRLPVDLLRLIEVMGDEGVYTPYQLENNCILTDSREFAVTYIKRPEDPLELSSGVRRAVYLALALLLTTVMTSNENTAGRISAEMQAALERAKTEDFESQYNPRHKPEKFYAEEREGRG